MNAETVNNEEARKRIRRSVRRMKGFYTHLGVYVLVNAMLFLINIVTSPGVYWFYWPLSGWGIGIVAHALSVFAFGRMFGPDWEERKIKELSDQI